MVDLTSEMASLLAALGPAPAYRGRVIQFASATAGEGVSTMAREFARLTAARARRPVWLVDADLAQQGQQDAVAAQPDRFGRFGEAAVGSPDGRVFYTVSPQLVGRNGEPIAAGRLLTARSCLGTRLWVTRFRMESLRSGQRADVVPDPHYWDAMRKHSDTVVIDSPAADRSDTAIVLAPFVDATIIVVAAETTAANEPVILRDEIESVGGRIAGVVVNRSRYKAPGFLKRLTG